MIDSLVISNNKFITFSNLEELLELRKKILVDVLIPYYERRIKGTVKKTNVWSLMTTMCYILSSFTIILSMICSFLNTYYQKKILSIVAGSFSIFAIILKEFGFYSQGRQKQNSLKTNTLLKTIGIQDYIPDLTKFDNNYSASISSPESNNNANKNSNINSNNGSEIICLDNMYNSVSEIDDMIITTAKSYNNIFDTNEIIELRKKIIIEIILPFYENKIISSMRSILKWSHITTICYCLSSIVIGTTSIISFINSNYNNFYLSIISGILSIVSIFLKEVGQYSQKKDHQTSNKVNLLLKKIGINEGIPDLSKYDNPIASTQAFSIKEKNKMPINNINNSTVKLISKNDDTCFFNKYQKNNTGEEDNVYIIDDDIKNNIEELDNNKKSDSYNQIDNTNINKDSSELSTQSTDNSDLETTI